MIHMYGGYELNVGTHLSMMVGDKHRYNFIGFNNTLIISWTYVFKLVLSMSGTRGQIWGQS